MQNQTRMVDNFSSELAQRAHFETLRKKIVTAFDPNTQETKDSLSISNSNKNSATAFKPI